MIMRTFGRAPRRSSFGKRPARLRRIAGWTALMLGVLTLLAAMAPALHVFGTRPYLMFPAHGRRVPVVAVMLSGDIGFGGGMSAHVASALADRGVMVLGVSSPVVFSHQRTRGEAITVVSQAIRTAVKISGAQRVLLVGQSFGADIVATAAPYLSPDLVKRIAVIDLMVPGSNVYFRADPVGFAYLFQADAHPAAALNAWRGPPLICIHGDTEADSLCPQLTHAATVIALPGDHHLRHDPARLVTAVMGALHRFVPAIRP
jgi:type IV secretory pathway VirJ component